VVGDEGHAWGAVFGITGIAVFGLFRSRSEGMTAMTFNHFTRRLHLYLAMLLMPWFFAYGEFAALQPRDYFQKTFGKPEGRRARAGLRH
jgi:hypothetical protein